MKNPSEVGIQKKNLKELIKFQLEKNKYIKEYQDDKYKKINIIKVCPYCRKSEFNNTISETINNPINNRINNSIDNIF